MLHVLPCGILCAKLTGRMISLVAPKRNEVIEHPKMFNASRMGCLNTAAQRVFTAGSREPDYTYDSPRHNYERGRLMRLSKKRKGEVIGAVNQRFQTVPQKTFTITSDETNGVFHRHICDYDSVSGVFIWLNQDPIQEAGGLNLYGYVHNNPINAIDPLGLWNLWSPMTWGVPTGLGTSIWNSLNPLDASTGYSLLAASQSDAAFLDGINPFGNPFANMGLYDPCDSWNKWSRGVGTATGIAESLLGVTAAAAAAADWLAPEVPSGISELQAEADYIDAVSQDWNSAEVILQDMERMGMDTSGRGPLGGPPPIWDRPFPPPEDPLGPWSNN
jgi:RHS repeat-associated protein